MKVVYMVTAMRLTILDKLYALFSWLTWGNKLRIASGSYVARSVFRLRGTGNIIGRNVIIWSEGAKGNVEFSYGVQISKACDIDCTGGIKLSSNVVISERVKILTHDHGMNPNNNPTHSKLSVGRAAWIGADSIILSGVETIGVKSIVGSGSVVTKNIPDYEIWAGNPAKKIGENLCAE
jgi:acetyltransferase-like isoleucine patch superfamily enzyme